jgi:16S rRNA G1207 methylase RsmC
MTTVQNTEMRFALSPDKELALAFAPGVFTPNATTHLLIRAAKDAILRPGRLLDLGCGTGVVGLALQVHNLVTPPLCASDLSESAVHCCRQNLKRHECPADVRSGSLFEPWWGERFDVIVDDISGISQDVAAVSPWFQGVPCDTGEDGTGLVAGILRDAPRHLDEGGQLLFPLLSLSNVDRLLQAARETFRDVSRVARQDWPLPAELKTHMPLLRKLHAAGSVKFEERFGMVLCYTEVYCAADPYTV